MVRTGSELRVRQPEALILGQQERRRSRSDDELQRQQEQPEREWQQHRPMHPRSTRKGDGPMETATKRRTGEEGTSGAEGTSSRVVEREDIARRAYERFEDRGREAGHDVEDWLQAENDLQQRQSTEH